MTERNANLENDKDIDDDVVEHKPPFVFLPKFYTGNWRDDRNESIPYNPLITGWPLFASPTQVINEEYLQSYLGLCLEADLEGFGLDPIISETDEWFKEPAIDTKRKAINLGIILGIPASYNDHEVRAKSYHM